MTMKMVRGKKKNGKVYGATVLDKRQETKTATMTICKVRRWRKKDSDSDSGGTKRDETSP